MKIEKDIYQHFISKSDKILMLTGTMMLFGWERESGN